MEMPVQGVGHSRPPRWMIVDDNEKMLSLLREIVSLISDAGVECFCVPEEALAAFAADPDAFTLVITDFEMPGMNGGELCRRLHELRPSLKVLLATGSGSLSLEEAAHSGFCGMVQKPFAMTALQSALDTAGVEKGSAD